MPPKISVIIPVYGVEKYLPQMLDSIRKQTFKEVEYILVDDGSPDHCPQMLDDFSKESSNYRVIHQENRGVSIARNTGLQKASGEYVYIVDSDDWLEKDALKYLWENVERTDADLIIGDWIREKKSGSERVISFPREFTSTDKRTINVLQCACNNNLPMRVKAPDFSQITHLGGAPWRYMVRRRIIVDNKILFDPYVRGLGDDIIFALQLYEYVHKVSYIQMPIYHYRILEDTFTHGYKPDLLERYDLVFESIDSFLKIYNKDIDFYRSYYNRVLLYLRASMDRYFKHEKNPKSSKERFSEFVCTMEKEPYRTARKSAKISEFKSLKTRISFLTLRYGLYRIYWLFR